jgi:hypothetical protein
MYVKLKILKAIYIFRNTHVNISKMESVKKKAKLKIKDTALKCKNVLELYTYK